MKTDLEIIKEYNEKWGYNHCKIYWQSIIDSSREGYVKVEDVKLLIKELFCKNICGKNCEKTNGLHQCEGKLYMDVMANLEALAKKSNSPQEFKTSHDESDGSLDAKSKVLGVSDETKQFLHTPEDTNLPCRNCGKTKGKHYKGENKYWCNNFNEFLYEYEPITEGKI